MSFATILTNETALPKTKEQLEKEAREAERKTAEAAAQKMLEDLHACVMAELRKGDGRVIETVRSEGKIIDTVDGIKVSLRIEEVWTKSYRARLIGKSAKLYFGYRTVASYPMKADGTFSVAKIAAKIVERVGEELRTNQAAQKKEVGYAQGKASFRRLGEKYKLEGTYWNEYSSDVSVGTNANLKVNEYGNLILSLRCCSEERMVKIIETLKAADLI